MSEIKVLDHGYVRFIEAWGHGEHCTTGLGANHERWFSYSESEAGIIEAARQSTQGSFRGWDAAECDCGLEKSANNRGGTYVGPVNSHADTCAFRQNPGDAKLLRFLYDNKHFTPFEFAGMVIEVQAPIFVFREWHRHRTQSYNEMSARYTKLPNLYYMPDKENVATRATTVQHSKQAEGIVPVRTEDFQSTVGAWQLRVNEFYLRAQELYEQALNAGVPKELARITMPLGHYSRMRASANLRNWLSFMTLRCDPAAQWEIRQFANTVGQLINEQFPRTYQLWNEAHYRT